MESILVLTSDLISMFLTGLWFDALVFSTCLLHEKRTIARNRKIDLMIMRFD
jgi:hypothetical protein